MAENLTFTIKLDGNAYTGIAELDKAMGYLNVSAKKTQAVFERLSATFFRLNNITGFAQNVAEGLREINAPGIALNSSLADLSAIAGVTGNGLKEIEGSARATAKTFGGSAAEAVESYKLILSQLSPEIAKCPKAMQAMGGSIATLSKMMGGSTTAAAEVLTTAMNQYGVSLADPVAASGKMAEMMNVMAAAAKEGSAELPQIKEALEQCGMESKAAGVIFAETNAAIQVLDKAGRKGAEGGVALRNVMATLSKGRFLPKEVKDELARAGVDINLLTDKTKSLQERLTPMQRVLKDSALFTKVFGRENAASAMALVQGIDEVGRYKDAITGTNTATEQASTIMDSYAERQARIKARFDDLKIGLFDVTGSLGIWAETLTGALVPMAQVLPLITAVTNGVLWLTKLQNLQAVATGICSAATLVWTGVMAAFNAVAAANPIAIIIIAVAALGAAMAVCWKKFAGFRAFVKTTWEVVKQFGGILKDFVIDRIMGVLKGIGHIGEAIAKLFMGDFKGAGRLALQGAGEFYGVGAVKNAAKGVKGIVDGTPKLYRDKLEREKERTNNKAGDKGITTPHIPGTSDGFGIGDLTGGGDVPTAVSTGAESAVTGGTRNTQITINVGKLIESVVFNGEFDRDRQTLMDETKEALARVLSMAVTAV